MNTLTIIGAAVVLIFAVARVIRLITFDSFPPVQYLRDRWDLKTNESGWNELFHCGFCAGFWVSLVMTPIAVGSVLGWGVFASFTGLLWVFLGVLAVGYIAAIIVATNWG